jgi:hypothetical protein
MKQLSELTAWAHFEGVINGQYIIGRKVNDRVAVCQNFTSNDKTWSAPVDFGTEYFSIKSLSQTKIDNYRKSGWFNENFYKVYENYGNLLKAA